MLDQEVRRWTASDAAELYDIARWGKGYFSVDDNGHVRVHPTKEPDRWLDLKQLVDRLQLRGIDLPILIRFAGILKHRLGEIHDAFAGAIAEHKYTGSYCCVYPIKVNQQRQVVEEVLRFGKPYQLRPRGRQQARAAGRRGHGHQRHADHLQRLQGRRVHRDGDAGPEDGPAHHPGRRKIHRAGADPQDGRKARRAADDRHARQAGRPRLGTLAAVGRIPLEVRADRHRNPARPRTS